MLDLWQQNSDVSARPQPGEGHDLPATFGDTFDAAWHEGQMFGSSIASFNARQAALNAYEAEVYRKTGQRLDLNAEGGQDLWAQANDQVRALKAKNPNLDIDPLPDDEIDRRAAAQAGEAHQAYADMSAREKTFGGKVGGVLGSMASGTVDPLNLVALLVAPEAELGVLGTAALWGGYAAGSQAVNEVVNAQFRQQAVPGYDEAPGNILGAGIGGAVLGGLFKGMGNVWTRMKTGEWPRSVRDAGNIIESEAQVQGSNVLPGVEGEAAHREAMGKAIDDIVAGRPVSVETSDVDTPIDAAMAQRKAAGVAAEEARSARAEPTGELPFEATAQEVTAEQRARSLTDQIKAMGVPEEDASHLAARVIAAKSDDEARAILNEAMARPQTIADTVPSVSAVARAERAAQADEAPARAAMSALTPEARAEALADPAHDVALMTDLERMRDQGQGGMIPTGVDEKGEPTYQLLDAAIQDAKNDQEAAAQIEACINPPKEEAAE